LNKLKSLAGQTVVYGMGTIVPRVLNYLLLTPFYTRIFEKGEYGIVTELYAYVAILLVILTYGMETGFFRFYNDENNKEKVYTTSILTLLFTSSLFILLVGFLKVDIATILKYPNNVEYVLWFSIIIGLDAFTTIPFAKLRAENKATLFSIIKVSNVSVNIFFNLLFFVFLPSNPDWKLTELIYNENIGVGYAFISNLIASSVTIILLLPTILQIRGKYDFSLIKKILNYSYPLIIVGVAGMINEVADKIFLKFLIIDKSIALEQVGIYGANYKLAVLMTIFIQMFRYAAEPFFFANEKEKDAKQLYADVMKYFIIFGLLIFLFVLLYIDVVKFFIDEKFHEGLFIVPIVLIANLFLGIYYNLSVWYKLTNKTIYGAVIATAGALLTIILNYLLIPIIGYYGSAIATIVCYSTMMIVSFLWGRRFYYIKYDIKAIALYFSLAIVIVFAFKNIHVENTILKYLFSTGLLVIFLSVVSYKENLKKLLLK
jgi:O-antigen/teichoic acid export membrane protein